MRQLIPIYCYLLIILKIPKLLLSSGFATCNASYFANILCHVSLPPAFVVMMSQLPLTLMIFDEPVLGSNAPAMLVFIWCNSMYIVIYIVATDHDLSHTLEEIIS